MHPTTIIYGNSSKPPRVLMGFTIEMNSYRQAFNTSGKWNFANIAHQIDTKQ